MLHVRLKPCLLQFVDGPRRHGTAEVKNFLIVTGDARVGSGSADGVLELDGASGTLVYRLVLNIPRQPRVNAKH